LYNPPPINFIVTFFCNIFFPYTERFRSDEDLKVDDTNLIISAKTKMGQNAVKFVYGTKDQGLANDATMMAVAYDHKINKSTTAYAIYANGSDDGLNANSGLAGDATVIGGGLVVKF